ncbi:hypothetical protein NDU88_008823 [Pleurodeles waltl]|uniref:Uncharacterized protein n=1 Tax=Pleurodeles waltl TaxID=8319 RepID=A0AAV7PQL3_PLEWA|nr:hypothetical protein NDU88_008823 [Pleurodeles waltl]
MLGSRVAFNRQSSLFDQYTALSTILHLVKSKERQWCGLQKKQYIYCGSPPATARCEVRNEANAGMPFKNKFIEGAKVVQLPVTAEQKRLELIGRWSRSGRHELNNKNTCNCTKLNSSNATDQ